MRNFVGILGAVFGHTLLNAMHIRTKAARGLAMGTASHALGTARCAELDYEKARLAPGAGDLRHYYLAGSALFVSAHSGGNALTTGQKTGLKFAIRRAFFI